MKRILVATALLALATVPASAQEFRWTGQVDRSDWLRVSNINGDIEVVPTSGSQIEVVAEKTARRGDVDDVRIEVVEHSGGVTICAIYPSRRSGETQECAGERFERVQASRSNVEVRFTVRAPRSVWFDGVTVNGDVDVQGPLARVEATTVNGDVFLEADGEAKATTVNGSIRARIAGNDLTGPVDLETVNGSIELDINDGINADVEAAWLSGGLDTEFPLRVRGRIGKSASGQLGSGGPTISLSTVNGSIEIS